MDKIINQRISSLRRDNTNKHVRIKTQAFNELIISTNYIDIAVGSNNGFSYTVAHKSTETESECYQLVGSLHETINFLKIEIKDKQAALINFINILNSFTLNEGKNNKRREQQGIKVHKKGNNDNIVSDLLQIDQLHHQFRKPKDQHNSADTPGLSVGVN